MQVILENIRSFAGNQTIPIRPLTLLVGENNSGKSTFLAVASCVFGRGFPNKPGFNEPPYSLGNFDSIATYKGGRHGRADCFSIGVSSDDESYEKWRVVASYGNDFGNVAAKHVKSTHVQEGRTWKFLGGFDVSSFAPIRSKPKRTYDEIVGNYSPEGDHIPWLLERLFREEPATVEGRTVQKALLRFGEESGLFKQVSVRKLGKKVGDPIQIQVGVAGPAVNLADVGYGVSQALPIVVQSVLGSSSKMLLLQQPEVHLHPRAQAALGSFFVELVGDGERYCLIETHSDYLVDRVRQEVANGRIDAKNVLILFFQKPHLETTVYPLYLDANGNIENAPDDYRKFFLEEELRLLTRTSQKKNNVSYH